MTKQLESLSSCPSILPVISGCSSSPVTSSTKQATASHLREAAELRQCIAASAVKRLLLQSRQTEECRERQTDRQTDLTDRQHEHCPGRPRHIGWDESLSNLAAGKLCHSQTLEQGSPPFRWFCFSVMPTSCKEHPLLSSNSVADFYLLSYVTAGGGGGS